MTCKLKAIIADLQDLKREVDTLLAGCQERRPTDKNSLSVTPTTKPAVYRYTLSNGRKKYTQDYQVALRYSYDQVITPLYAGGADGPPAPAQPTAEKSSMVAVTGDHHVILPTPGDDILEMIELSNPIDGGRWEINTHMSPYTTSELMEIAAAFIIKHQAWKNEATPPCE